jgi:hypothetical protein
VALKVNLDMNLSHQRTTLLDRHPKLLVVVLLTLFLMAGTIRLYRLQAHGVLLERDLGSAILARDLFYEHVDTVPLWQKNISAATRQKLPLLEPPVTEYFVSVLYRIAGREQLWMARVLTSFFWLAGGIFLYKIARKFTSRDGSVVAVAYYLFAPLSIVLSRSFQPDALMMLMFLASLFCIVKFHERPTMSWLGIAAVMTGLTLLHRPIVLFTLFAAFAAISIAKHGSWKSVFRRQSLLFFGISLLPCLLYYGYGAFVTDSKQAVMSFQPFLLLQKEYWRGWLDLGLNATGTTALVAALIGMALLPKEWPLAMMTGLWIGYLIFGFVFVYHIHTHGYYHAQLIVIVALSFGSLVSLLSDQLKTNSNRWVPYIAVIAIVLLAMVSNVRQVRGMLQNQQEVEKETAQTIGQIIDHSDETVFIAKNYGVLLQYYGELTGAPWPRRVNIPLYQSSEGLEELTVEDRLTSLGFIPKYFVISDFDQYYAHHADLKDYLLASCTKLAERDDYLIYSNCVK